MNIDKRRERLNNLNIILAKLQKKYTKIDESCNIVKVILYSTLFWFVFGLTWIYTKALIVAIISSLVYLIGVPTVFFSIQHLQLKKINNEIIDTQNEIIHLTNKLSETLDPTRSIELDKDKELDYTKVMNENMINLYNEKYGQSNSRKLVKRKK